MWEKFVHEAKGQERTCLEYKDFRQSVGETGSTPTIQLSMPML